MRIKKIPFAKYCARSQIGMANDLTEELREILEQLDCVTGTLHRADGEVLHLVTQHGMPPELVELIETIPFGKGMAGNAASREQPIHIGHLQTSQDEAVEPGAKLSGMEGSLAAPIFAEDGEVIGVIGIAKPDVYEFDEAEQQALLDAGAALADKL